MSKLTMTKKAFRVYHGYNTKYFPLKLLQIMFQNVTPFFNLWMSAEIVTALYEGRERKDLYLLVAISLLGNLFIQLMGALLQRVTTVQLQVLQNNEAAAFNQKTLSLDYDKLENPEIRQHRRRILENAYVNNYGVVFMRQGVEHLMSCVVNLVYATFLFVEMMIAVLRYPVQWLALLFLGGMIVSLIIVIRYQFKTSEKMAKNWKRLGDLILEENRLGRGYDVNGLDNRIYKQQGIITAINERMSKLHLKEYSKVYHRSTLYEIPNSFLSRIGELMSYLFVILYCGLGAFPVGGVVKYTKQLSTFRMYLSNLFNIVGQLASNEPYLQTYLEYFDIANDMYQGSLAVEKRSDRRFDIEFKNVSFRYAGVNEEALKNINLKLKVGERLAVVGMNGSGKTTFIKLLCRLYDPAEGEILMNDFNIRKYDYRQYLDLFSVVFQDFHLMALPLGNNVASAENWDVQKAERLLTEVGFGQRYSEMNRKLDTPLYKNFDEDGVNISGGEAQKIALAKALYRDAPFIVLDEPTAALDPIAEAEIYSKFDEIVGDKTAIYISHRLSSCRFCDKIAVFDKGEIVQVGTHEELLADSKGKYYELWNAQAQYYVAG